MRNVRCLLAAVALVVALVGTARADKPACTGDRHYDDEGQCCPVATTTTTLVPASCESDEDCQDFQQCEEGVCVSVCPDPGPCPDCKLTCPPADVCVSGACVNGSTGTGNGACTKDSDCTTDTTVNNTTNVFNVTVNRCPAQEPTLRCGRAASGRLSCPAKHHPHEEQVPYSQALKFQNPKAKRPIFKLPPPGPTAKE